MRRPCVGIRRPRTREMLTRSGSSWTCIRRGLEFRETWKSRRDGRGLGQRPDHGVLRARLWFAEAVIAALAFSLGLFALQFHKLTGWQHFCVAVFVHSVGTFLVINCLIT